MSIYDLIQEDHDRVIDLLDNLIALGQEDPGRAILIHRVRDELIPHSRAEEVILYNSLRMLDAGQESIDRAYATHREAEVKLRTLESRSQLKFDWREAARDLRETLLRHIDEEEDLIFLTSRHLFTAGEAHMMGEAFAKLKAELGKTHGALHTAMDMARHLMPKRLGAKYLNALRRPVEPLVPV